MFLLHEDHLLVEREGTWQNQNTNTFRAMFMVVRVRETGRHYIEWPDSSTFSSLSVLPKCFLNDYFKDIEELNDTVS